MFITVPWNSKPPFGTPLNPAHPLCQGLEIFYALNVGGGVPMDVVTGISAVANTATWGFSARTSGPRLYYNGTASTYTQLSNDAALNSWSGATSIIAGAAPAAGGANQHILDARYTSGNYGYYFGVYSGGVLYCTTPNPQIVGGGALVDGNYHTWGVSHLATTTGGVLFYRDGVQVATGTTGFPAAGPPASPNRYIGCNYNDSGTYFSGGIDWIGAWSRALTAREQAAMALNPWQIFQPLGMWIPEAAAITAPIFRRTLFARAGSRGVA